ncbi:MAG: S53 family peptidase [Terracidiphilus sp.]
MDESRWVALAGNVHPLARPEFELGAVEAGTRLERMVLVLEPGPARQTELEALLEAQQDPRSPLFRQWLTPAGFETRFGVSAAGRKRVEAWLAGHGFRLDEAPAGGRLLIFSGTAAEVEEAFHAGLRRYRVEGAEHLANSRDPELPASLAGLVRGVLSLHDFRRAPQMVRGRALGAAPEWNLGGNHYLFPTDYAAIYDLNPLYSTGVTGAGASIAIAGRSNILPADVAAFRAAAGLEKNAPEVILDGPDPGLVAGDQDEATLDVEWAGAVGRSARVKLVAAASTATTDGVDLAAAAIVSRALAPVLSVSFGSCEQAMGASELAFYNGLWQQAAAEGISVLVASGDSGAAGCTSGWSERSTETGVNGLCTSPFATCVGGTEFNEGADPGRYWAATNSPAQGSALDYIPETVWNESGANEGQGLWASGGGVSRVHPQPVWQQSAEGAAQAGTQRAVPDLAMTAAAHDGSAIYENGSYWIVSGTSAAAPSLAGLFALVVQARGGQRLGSLNPALYKLASGGESPFHRTPAGSNSVPGVDGFTAAGAVYNLATGLGSVDGALLAERWPASVPISIRHPLPVPVGPRRRW